MKRMSWMLGAVVVGVAALTGCSSEKSASSKEALTVQGSVSSRLNTDNARAVAIGEDGKKVWTYLDKNGDFTLKLPVGKSYRVLIANQLPSGGQKVIGKVSLQNGAEKTQWLAAKAGGKVNLGTLSKEETTVSGVAPKCFCDDDKSGSSSSKGDSKGDEDFGDDDDFPSDKGGYGDKGSDKGNWDDGEWGGGGWEADEESDSTKGSDKGSEKDFDKDADHDDDNDCFGDDEDFFGDKEGWSKGKGKDGSGKELDEDDLCDVCTDGGFIDLKPSKKDAANWADKGKKVESLPESKACTKKTDAKKDTADKKPTDPKADPTDKEPAADKEPKEPAKGEPTGENPKENQTKKDVGAKCSVKSECGGNSCIAATCVVK